MRWGRRPAAGPIRAAGREGLGPLGLAALACALALSPGSGGRAPAAAASQAASPQGEALRARLTADHDTALAAAYAQRGFRPLWVDDLGPTPAAHLLARRLSKAREEGLEPADYDAADIARALRRSRTPDQLVDLELRLSRAYVRYALDLREPPPPAALAATDRDVDRPLGSRSRVMAAAARSPDLLVLVQNLTPTNPVYQGLRAALAAHRQGKAADAPFDAYEQALALNLARARALPPDADDRFVLVDAAAAQLWLYENGRPVLSMPVAVGTLHDPTPLMSGVIRFAVYHPYWYVPPDLARETFAPRALKDGPAALTAAGLEVLSDWTDNAVVVDPARVDWRAVADGRQLVRLRQRPGPDNMMGSVKLMLPNRFGIYLHDTPDHRVFEAATRNFSHGCVRLADARALARALGAPPPPSDAGAAAERVDLPAPIPVYITYFTARATDGGKVAFAPDVYRRDAPLVAAMTARRQADATVQFAAR